MDNRNLNTPSLGDSVWKGIAIVSGVFSLILIVLLFFNASRHNAGLPDKELVYSAELEEKKALLSKDPNNEELIEEIRRLDLELRQSYFASMAFSNRGKYLLLISIVIFLISTNKAMPTNPNQFRPKKKKDIDPNLERYNLKKYRQAVSGTSALILLGIILLVSIPKIPLETSEETATPAPTYPSQEEIQKNWPRFRGPGGLGVSTHTNVPTYWNGESGEGILWKKEILLPGNNSPIAWGDKVFISGANEEEKAVFCYSVPTGELLWRGDVTNIPGSVGQEINVFQDTGYAASTMATDGMRVYAIFANGDLVSFDFDGNLVWAKSLGVPDSIYTFATSLATYQNLLLIQFDQGEEEDEISEMIALDGKNGQVVWRQKRPVANSWTSPIVVNTPVGEQVITSSEPWVIAYTPATGEELWRANLLGVDLAPSPVYAKGIAFAIQPNETLFAIKVDGRGDVTESHLAWEVDCPAPEISSPVCSDEHIYLVASMGLISCYEIETGELVWEEEIEDYFMASPVLVGEWMYLTAESGNTYRMKIGTEPEIAEEVCSIDEFTTASPAVLDGKIFIRSEEHLYCIGTP